MLKKDHGVFYGDPIEVTQKAWGNKGDIIPISDKGVDIYHIYRPNAGYAGGYAGQGQNLNFVTIITESGTNRIITAYPSFGN